MHTPAQQLRLLAAAVGLAVATTGLTRAELIELAYYRLGESDANAAAGQAVETTVDEIGLGDEFRDMDAVFGVEYSDETPPGIDSSRSIRFPADGYLVTAGTPWHSLPPVSPGFRVGMEAFVKVDPSMQDTSATLFANGSLYGMTVGDDGYYHANQTPEGITPIEYGQWQHVAFWTTGSVWQVYVNGEQQFPNDARPNFTYGGGGDATVGASQNGDQLFEGLIDEYRIFTWTGAFDPADLLYFQQRQQGDVNDDGLVDRADYDIWRSNVGKDLTGLALADVRALGDLNTDRQIDLDDFAQIKANLTPAVAAAMAPVPEPATWLLLLVGVAGWATCQRRGMATR